MKITYDNEVDAMHIRLLDGPFQCRTVRLSDVVALNIGPAEELVGIEILDAKKTLRFRDEPEIDLANLKVGVSE
jgi:uncharacterized protein YuzE